MQKAQFQERIAAAGRRLVPDLREGELLGVTPELDQAQVEKLKEALQLSDVTFFPIGGHLWSAVTGVTPELAFYWLTERNDQNRDPIRAQYEAIENDIRSGQWELTHQGIAFRADGKLVDGQHRLFAVLDAGQSVLMMITLNVSAKAALVIDRHRSRRARDLLSFAAHRMTPFDEAVIRRAILGMSSSSVGPTVPTIVAFLEFHRERLEWASSLFKSRGRGVVIAPLVAAVFRASFHVSGDARERLELFADVLQSGVAKSERERAAVLLREWLMARGRTTRKRAQGHESYARIIRAMSAFLSGEQLGKLYGASTDLYPLPTTSLDDAG